MTLRIGMKANNLKRSSGFTFIELMLVILLISVLAGLSVPLIRHASADLELKDTSFTLAKMISYAQEMAVLESTTYQLNLDPAKSAFWLTRSGEVIKSKIGKKFRLPHDLTLETKARGVLFYPDGRADDAEISIIGKNAGGTMIRVKGLLNEVEVSNLGPK